MRLKTNKLNFYVEDEVREKLEKLAKESGLRENNIKTQLFRIRGELKDYLLKEGVYYE